MKKLVRKATELKDLKELNLDSRTRAQIKQKMKKKGWSFEDLVFFGRKIAYNTFYENGERMFSSFGLGFSGSKLYDNLVDALDDAGFIRHDIGDVKYRNLRTDRQIIRARRILSVWGDINCSIGLSGLYDPDSLDSYVYNPIMDNKHYETYAYSTSAQFQSFVRYIMRQLPRREASVFLLRIGRSKTLDAVGEELGISRERARQIEAKMFRYLRERFKSQSQRAITDFISVETIQE